MKLSFARGAWRQWNHLPKEVRDRLQKKIQFYVRDPRRYAIRLTDIKIGQYRFKIGNYRIIFDISGDTIIILALGHRKDIYK